MELRKPDTAVDVVPFAAHARWVDANTHEIWWEDPRDIHVVQVCFGQTDSPPEEVRLEYWQNAWPKVRVPKGALVGAGSSGWLANDDWTNGRWQPADCSIERDGDLWTSTFRPLSAQEFPDADYPVTFRRTLKLRLRFDRPAAGLAQVRAFTDSVWREAEVAIEWNTPGGGGTPRNGQLEAFNGEVLELRALTPDTFLDGQSGWRSMATSKATGGIAARIRYAANEDPNSYDVTIVTVCERSAGFSFSMEDVLRGDPIYVRDLGMLVSRAVDGVRLSGYEAGKSAHHGTTVYQRTMELPEQTWERAWAAMPVKGRFYFVLGCEGSRQKIGIDPTGELFLREGFIRRVPGKDTERLGGRWKELRYSFGLPAVEPLDRSLLEGELPVIRSTWTQEDLVYEQEAFATWLWEAQSTERPAGDDPVVAMVRLRITGPAEAQAGSVRLKLTATADRALAISLHAQGKQVYASGDAADRLCYVIDGPGTLREADGTLFYEADLPAATSHTLYLRVPFIDASGPGEVVRLLEMDYTAERARVIAFWRQRMDAGAQIETPNAMLNAFYRTHTMHMLVINDRQPGSHRTVARCGGFDYGSFPDEGCMVISDLDRRGYTLEAERCLDLYLDYQGTAPLPGNYSSAEGVFYGSGGYEVAGYNRNQGWVMWCLAEHYRYTRDRAWLERAAPALIKACDWISRERQATQLPDEQGNRPIGYGFLPQGSLEDVTDYWTWLSTNAYAYLGMRAVSEVLVEIEHPEAARIREATQAYRHDLRAGFGEACLRSPVVRLRDGTWVPHFPARQERRGRDFGWLREVLEGAAHLIYCGLIEPDETAARWIIEDYEDNLFLSDQYGYPPGEFERHWHDWGGFSMQPNLLIFPLLYLRRDEPKHYLRSVFNPLAAALYPDTMMLTEHPLPTLADWRGDHFKTSDEANATYWLRLMFLAEHGDELFIGQALPRAWFEEGKRMRVARALTHFGETSLEITSYAATGSIVVRLEPPRRNPPAQIRVRVRHPQGQPARTVTVNGKLYGSYNPHTETLSLGRCTEALEIRFLYGTAAKG